MLRGPTLLVSGLGIAQLFAWGTLYYGIAVLGEPMRLELALSKQQLYGAFAGSLLIAGLLAPWAGRLVDRHGGRWVLASSAVMAAVSFAIVASAHAWTTLLVGWMLGGVAMALGLYDTAFAALAQAQPLAYRRSVTGITLLAGLASTLSWPSSHYLLEALGWRVALWVYATLLFLVCLPLYLWVLPTHHKRGSHSFFLPACAVPTVSAARETDSTASGLRKGRARLLLVAFAASAFVTTALSAHLITALQSLHIPAQRAVWTAALVGVMQVAGRAAELAFGSRLSAKGLGALAFAGLALALFTLPFIGASTALTVLFVAMYGAANGVITIVKATVPIEMFGMRDAGAVLGKFAGPGLVARAIAPLVFATCASSRLGMSGALLSTATIASLGLLAYLGAMRGARSLR